jgi:hypothetical protein
MTELTTKQVERFVALGYFDADVVLNDLEKMVFLFDSIHECMELAGTQLAYNYFTSLFERDNRREDWEDITSSASDDILREVLGEEYQSDTSVGVSSPFEWRDLPENEKKAAVEALRNYLMKAELAEAKLDNEHGE